MPLLIAPVFNSIAPEPMHLDLSGKFQLVSGNEKLYERAHRYLRNAMDENRLHFEEKVKPFSLFLVCDYPHMKLLPEDRGLIGEIEGRLNLASEQGVCSIPYVVTLEGKAYGVTYLKRSLDGDRLILTPTTSEVFERLLVLESHLPQVAYRRYMLSLEKESYEDQLLDLWIALESLFVPDGKKGEITYKVRHRLAYYFGETLDEREKISAFIKASYNHRSEIVHSGKMLGVTLRDEIKLLKQITRATLINMFMEGIDVNPLRKRLDELVLAGESYTKRYAPPHFEKITLF